MSVVKKHPLPANDPHLYAAQRLSCVTLTRPHRVDKKSLIGGSLLIVAVLLIGIAVTKTPPKLSAIVLPPRQSEPFDIKLNASELAPEDEVAAIAANLPTHVLETPKAEAPQASPPAMEITVGESGQQDLGQQQDDAAFQASSAQQALGQGNLKQALRFQHQAAVLAPDNNRYRLDLAILYDRLGHKKSAAVLYRQIVVAYEAHDLTLPHQLDINAIQQRLDYLSNAALDAP